MAWQSPSDYEVALTVGENTVVSQLEARSPFNLEGGVDEDPLYLKFKIF
jgi:hypothetical protein